MQAAVLSIKLKRLAAGNDSRRRIAAHYGKLLAGSDRVSLPAVAAYSTHVFHLYVVRVKERDAVLQGLGGRGVSCGIHYPKPVHLQKAYAHLGLGRGALPVTERCADQILSLPMYPELSEGQVETVARELLALLHGS